MKAKKEFDYFTISRDRMFPDEVMVYGWGTYPRNSVLAGQPPVDEVPA